MPNPEGGPRGQSGYVGEQRTIARRTSPDAHIHIMRHRPIRTDYLNGHTEGERREMTLQEIIHFTNTVNALGAINIHEAIASRYRTNPPSGEDLNRFGVELDNLAADNTEQRLHKGRAIFHMVAWEGAKEASKFGDEGKVRVISGERYGLGHEVPFDQRERLAHMTGYTTVDLAGDGLEETGKAKRNQPGAYATLAGIRNGEISRVPTEEEARYMDRIVASPRVKRLGAAGININADLRHNVDAVRRAYQLSSIRDVEAVLLDRDRNREAEEELRSMGLRRIWTLEAGDLMPALAILSSDRPIISLGSGGKEEAIVAALAAKATGGFFEGRYVDVDGKPVESRFGRRHTLSNLITGADSEAFVSLASITGTYDRSRPHGERFNVTPLDMNPVLRANRSSKEPSYHVQVGSIDGSTRRFVKSVMPITLSLPRT
jgi:hypothetical protein